MKILMTSDTFLPQVGGAEIHVANIVENLLAAGHQVSLIVAEEEAAAFDQGKDVVRIAWRRFNLFKILRTLWRRSKDADIIHSHYCYRLAMLTSVVGRLRGIPVVITLHGLGILDEPKKAPWVYRFAHDIFRYVSLKLSSLVISTSQDLANVAYRYIPKSKIKVIPSGYDERAFKDIVVPKELENKYQGRKIILTVRRLVPKNGLHYLVGALSYIKERVPNVLYLMIGSGRMEEYIKSRIKDLQLSDSVEMLGEIPNDQIAAYLKLSEVIVFPSTAESSSLACAEAMAMGKKIVASRVGGLVELIGKDEERGTLVRLVDWEGSNYDAPLSLPVERYTILAQAVVENLSDKYNDKTQQAYRYAYDNLRWEVIGRKTEAVYKQLINERTGY